ncbi:hypothetical protein EOA33_06150 [Mesorhizobium sp. M4A.F.Ca.ET.050.02.1.1]|uniref:hypothetical protein n=1 Tax=Mesorhizobium sp. M4A.F.Ca.ET.050.02.1.1 TaxID=2496754 RepID=UPI000FCA09AB|nr:hypothetical protein [Mesorhizobium sp. M4A.F.Ca.ET.050.02.1.1]RUX51491.1 hypothetical protein EOA33_06150 [Mesorhizobium sp. M4A.F.Ca.ET.050.02.1.1]
MNTIRSAGAFCAATFILAVWTSGGAFASQDVLGSFLTLNGNCLKLIALGKDMSPYCRPVLSSNNMSGGRVLFHFTLRNDAVLTIVGKNLPNPTPDTDAIAMQRIYLNLGIQGVAPSVASASGKCTFNNPYKGPMTLSCKGRADGKPLGRIDLMSDEMGDASGPGFVGHSVAEKDNNADE